MYSVKFKDGGTEEATNYKELVEIAIECCDAQNAAQLAANELGLKKEWVIDEFIEDYIHSNAVEIIEDFGCTVTENTVLTK